MHHLTLDSYLAPLKDELLSAWNNGMEITVDTAEGLKHNTLVHLALTCVACDIPATKKVGGQMVSLTGEGDIKVCGHLTPCAK